MSVSVASRIIQQILHRSAVNGLTFASRFLLLRTLGLAFLPEEYGVYVIIGTVLTVSVQVIGLYLYTYMTRYASGKPVLERMTILKTILAFELLLALVLIGVVVGTGLDSMLLMLFHMESYLWVARLAAPLLLLDVVLMEFVHYHYAVRRIEVANVIEFIASCGWVFPLVGLWTAGWSLTLQWLLIAWLLGMVGGISYGFWKLERKAFRDASVNWALLQPGLAFSLPIMFASIGDRIIFLVDRWLLGFFKGPESVGRYGYALSLINILSALVSTSVAGVMVPYVVEANDSRKQHQRDELLAAMLKYSLLLLGYGLMVLLVYGDLIIGWLARAEYHQGAGSLLLWLAPIPVLTAIMAPASNLLFIQNKTLVMTWISSTGVVAGMVLNALLIPSYGVIGAAVAMDLSLGMTTVLQYWAVRSEDTTRWRTSRTVEIIFACAITGTLFFVLNRWRPSDGLVLSMASVLAMGVVYGLLLVALRVLGSHEWDMIVKWWAGAVVPQHSGR